MTYANYRWIGVSLCLAVSLLGCNTNAANRTALSDQIDALTTSSAETIDLSQVGATDWSRMCVLTPYSSNQTAEEILGFEWDVDKKTDIEFSDSITLLIFASDDEVEAYVEYPRANGNFSSVGSSCIEREQAKFTRKQGNFTSFTIAD